MAQTRFQTRLRHFLFALHKMPPANPVAEFDRIMTTMIFYEKPVALNRERHRQLRLHRDVSQYGFARETNSVLLAASEMDAASKDYPIVFAGGANGQFALAGLLGLRDRENLFVSEPGHWREGTYVPAFVRRYPFVLAEDAAGKLTVCVDESFPGLGEAQGDPLFDEQGQDTKMLQGSVDFLRLFHVEMQRTRAFTARLAALQLLVPKTLRIQRLGSQQVLEGVYVVDEKKLRELSDADVLELWRAGYLAWIHVHLSSLGNIERLARWSQPESDAAQATEPAPKAAKPSAKKH